MYQDGILQKQKVHITFKGKHENLITLSDQNDYDLYDPSGIVVESAFAVIIGLDPLKLITRSKTYPRIILGVDWDC